MQIHNLKRTHKNKRDRLVGRGGKHAKTSGRGGKGQTARAGNKKRPEMRDIIKKLPKLRGYKFNSTRDKHAVVNLGALEALQAGSTVTPELLLEHKLIRRNGGKIPRVKILGLGDINVKVTFTGVLVSKEAKAKIEKAGGTIS